MIVLDMKFSVNSDQSYRSCWGNAVFAVFLTLHVVFPRCSQWELHRLENDRAVFVFKKHCLEMSVEFRPGIQQQQLRHLHITAASSGICPYLNSYINYAILLIRRFHMLECILPYPPHSLTNSLPRCLHVSLLINL